MNMKKLTLISVSLILAAASAFAWTKKSENTGNLGRMYVSLGGGVNMSKLKDVSDGSTVSPTGGYGEAVINAPVFKPGVNAFRKIKWAGVDAQAFFNYNYSGNFDLAGAGLTGVSSNTYAVGAGLKPYLNFVIDAPALQAIKPFGIAYCGYEWNNYSWDGGSQSENYFIYGVGGGVEFVILDQLSFTPTWQWRGNSESGQPCYQVVTAELSYWVTDQFCFAAFWTHNFGADGYGDKAGTFAYNVQHGDIIGMKFKIGFMR